MDVLEHNHRSRFQIYNKSKKQSQWLCAFVVWSKERVRQLRRTSCRMDKMDARCGQYLKDDPAGMKQDAADIKPTRDPVEGIAWSPTKFMCRMVQTIWRVTVSLEGKAPKDDSPKTRKRKAHVLPVRSARSFGVELFIKKEQSERVYSASLFSRQNVNSALHTIEVYMCGKSGFVLMDSECSRAIVSRKICRTVKKKDVGVRTLSIETCINGDGQIYLQRWEKIYG